MRYGPVAIAAVGGGTPVLVRPLRGRLAHRTISYPDRGLQPRALCGFRPRTGWAPVEVPEQTCLVCDAQGQEDPLGLLRAIAGHTVSDEHPPTSEGT